MHVALVHMRSARVGGTESYLNQVSRGLCERGHDVTIVCRSHEDAPHPRVRFVVLHRMALGGAARIVAFARDVERHLREHEYDLVVGLGRTWSQDVIRVSGGCHATYLERAHPYSTSRLGRWLGSRLGQISLKHRAILAIEARALAPGAARCVIVNSELVRRDVVARYGVDPAGIRLIRNGVDLERFHPRHRDGAGRELRERLGIAGPGPVVLFLGSNYGRKGLDVLLEAFPAFHRAHPAASLLVVGADADLAAWKRRARSLSIESVVHFLGKRSDTEACYGAADLYVLPTRYDSFAYTVLEALASGVPAVVSDGAGAAEVVDPACGTVISWTAGPGELESALSTWGSADRCRQASAVCRRVAEQNGSDSAAERTIALFEDLARASRTGSPRASGTRG